MFLINKVNKRQKQSKNKVKRLKIKTIDTDSDLSFF